MSEAAQSAMPCIGAAGLGCGLSSSPGALHKSRSLGQGRGEIVAMQQMVDSLQSSMRLLVASVRSPDDIVALASQVLPSLSVSVRLGVLAWGWRAQ